MLDVILDKQRCLYNNKYAFDKMLKIQTYVHICNHQTKMKPILQFEL